jgi:ParB-like chromosome segregation protein Spo0J
MDLVGVLMEELGSQEAAARALGKSASWLSKRKRVLAQPVLAAAVAAGEITLDHAYDVLTHARTERGMVAHLRRIKAGEQSQDQTRAARRENEPQVGDQGETQAEEPVGPYRQAPSTRQRDGTTTMARASAPRAAPPPDRSSRSVPVVGAGKKGDKVVLSTLSIVRLTKEHGKRALRSEVLAALRADIESLS